MKKAAFNEKEVLQPESVKFSYALAQLIAWHSIVKNARRTADMPALFRKRLPCKLLHDSITFYFTDSGYKIKKRTEFPNE